MASIPSGRRVDIHMGAWRLGKYFRHLPSSESFLGVQLWTEKNNVVVGSKKKCPLLKLDLTQVETIPQ